MARGVSFEFRDRLSDPRWRRAWTCATVAGSALVPLLLGIALGDLLHGLPINSSHEFTGNFFDLLTPYGIWMGVTLLALSLFHGATFLTLKTTSPVSDRADRAARMLAWPAVAAVVGFSIWTRAIAGEHFASPLIALAVIAVGAAGYLAYARQHAWAFAASAATIATTMISLFAALYPNVIVSSTNSAFNLTVSNSSSAKYALTVMTVVAVLFTPLVLLYQAWSYRVFRARVGAEPAEESAPPAATADS
jgi:cytochrome d ubiquinol oxidase subunit II